LQNGVTVRALIRPSSNAQTLESLGVEIVRGNVTDSNSVENAVKGVQRVFHLAALYRQEAVTRQLVWDTHVTGTRVVLEASLKAGVHRVVHCSTVGVQGAIANPPATESDPYNPGDDYQRTKMEGELLAIKFFMETGLPGVIVRPAGIYGPGDLRFLKLFKHIQNRKFVMFGNGEVLYHFTYVADLIRGMILSSEKPEAIGQIYTLAGNEYVTLNTLVALIANCLGVPIPRWRLPFWPLWLASLGCEIVLKPLGIEPPLYRRRADFFRKNRAFDISKAKSELGYSPKYDMTTGLQITAEWYRQNGYLSSK
jgi:nucleoside-diphosphate-sugar epimerase